MCRSDSLEPVHRLVIRTLSHNLDALVAGTYPTAYSDNYDLSPAQLSPFVYQSFILIYT